MSSKFSFTQRLMGFLELLRPLEWSKTLMNLLFGSFLAVQALPNVPLMILGFIAAGPLLWGGLYALNDVTDASKDLLHPVKKFRPIPSGKVPKNFALLISIIFILAALVIGYFINIFFLACLIVMILNQLLYTLKPFRLKEKPVLDIVSGSMINPLFRFFAGWTLFVQNFSAPILFLVFIVGLQAGGYTLYRLSGKETEKKLGYKSSVTVFGEKTMKLVAYVLAGIGILAFVLITLSIFLQSFFPTLISLGNLPFKFAALWILSIFAIPLYAKAVLDPQKMDMKKVYRLIYIHNLLFLIGFIILWVV